MDGDQDLPMEAMLVQSALNIRLESANDMLKEILFKPLQGLTEGGIDPTIACLGIQIRDAALAIRKSQLQFSIYYDELTDKKYFDDELCKAFFLLELGALPVRGLVFDETSPFFRFVKMS